MKLPEIVAFLLLIVIGLGFFALEMFPTMTAKHYDERDYQNGQAWSLNELSLGRDISDIYFEINNGRGNAKYQEGARHGIYKWEALKRRPHTPGTVEHLNSEIKQILQSKG